MAVIVDSALTFLQGRYADYEGVATVPDTSIMDWVFLRGHAGRWTGRLRRLTAWPPPVGEQQIGRVGAGLEGQWTTGEVAGDRARGGGA